MRRLALLALLIGCKAPADPGEATTLRWKPPAVHDRVTHTRSTRLALDIARPDAMAATLSETHDEVRVTEVIEVEGDHATKVKVRYDKVESHQRLGDDERVTYGPHQGKIYVVWKDGAEVHVTNENGLDALPDEHDAVSDDVGDELGRIPGMAQVIVGSAWRTGVTVQLTAPELVLMTESEPSTAAHAGTIMLESVAGDVATFRATIDATLDSAQGTMQTAQTITIHAEVATGHIVDATVDAKLDGQLAHGATATGTLAASVQARWN